MRKLEFMDEPELTELMTTLATGVEAICDGLNVERPLFCLVLFNDPAVAQFISNCNRKEMIEAMRETADRMEKKDFIGRVPFTEKGL
jgi:hypothetical protein